MVGSFELLSEPKHSSNDLITTQRSQGITCSLIAHSLYCIFHPMVAALHYSLNMTPELSHSEAKKKKKIIAKSFVEHMTTVIEQVQPDKLAEQLYGIGVLDMDERDHALNNHKAVEDRASELVQLLKRKLWLSPEWFGDICKILRNCGAKVIAQVIGQNRDNSLSFPCTYHVKQSTITIAL